MQCLGRIRKNTSKTIKVHFSANISQRVIKLTGLPDEQSTNDVSEHLKKTLTRFKSAYGVTEFGEINSDPIGLKNIMKMFTAERQITEYPAVYLTCIIRFLREVCLKKYSTFVTTDPCRGEALIRSLIQLDTCIGNRNKSFVCVLFGKRRHWFERKIKHSYVTVFEKCVRLTDIDAGRTNENDKAECASELLEFASMLNERPYILYPYLSVCIDNRITISPMVKCETDHALSLTTNTWTSPIDSINNHPIGNLSESETDRTYVNEMVTSFVVNAFNTYQIDHHQYDCCVDVKDLNVLGQLYKLIRKNLMKTRFDADEDGLYVTDIEAPREFYNNHSDLIDSVYLAFHKKQVIR